ncbi:RNA polymerase, sigma-24 subunit, ECF subfamily [Desulfofarcimen acetoxidans DSM 771]|uniref:RNA polymerase, sigma-24 subunit, ECF subfamily n=1 Tax=Desulfofarcimen acetoxidans (strain ATCC 49208 / DSM 771 / KCTC 5769 / VKM B-1644 / 5575) TaxID=485916 RepID=C8VX55_DESAS|nr:sigma-70 family RNA polymerase sigma factor [Desulfofarcimen acetoxidans]ACV62631.1 RNA polymerase, sigma-24 subunit, ECF subfamily [Desulfofarcimen acetoxidans DSM 771]
MIATGELTKTMRDEDLSFEELYDRHFAAVNRYLRYRVVSIWDADDLTAIVFMKAMEKYHQFTGSGSFISWLFRITHNTMVDYFKMKKDIPSDLSYVMRTDSITNEPEEITLYGEEVALLRELILKLPGEQRDVLSLRYAGELRFKQIGEVLGKHEGAVRTIHHRALKQLRSMFAERGAVPDER